MTNGIIAAVLSFLIPGLGQAYAGDIKKGVIFFAIALVLGVILGLLGTGNIIAIIFTIISLAYHIYAAYDAYKMIE